MITPTQRQHRPHPLGLHLLVRYDARAVGCDRGRQVPGHQTFQLHAHLLQLQHHQAQSCNNNTDTYSTATTTTRSTSRVITSTACTTHAGSTATSTATRTTTTSTSTTKESTLSGPPTSTLPRCWSSSRDNFECCLHQHTLQRETRKIRMRGIQVTKATADRPGGNTE
jgi:hypothetical protein